MARNENPGALGGATGASVCQAVAADACIVVVKAFNRNKSISFTWQGENRQAKGRAAWFLLELIRAGVAGCNALDHPGARIAAYAHTLRTDHGLPIETVHGRYVLRAEVRFAEGAA